MPLLAARRCTAVGFPNRIRRKQSFFLLGQARARCRRRPCRAAVLSARDTAAASAEPERQADRPGAGTRTHLKSLLIKDFASVEEQTVVFSEGLNVLTGPSGSGKSVLLSALSVALGAAGSADMVRSRSQHAGATSFQHAVRLGR
jgi:ABC-type transport system involved in cytochrome bd biosynthesis fused ATPase/permease subunit